MRILLRVAAALLLAVPVFAALVIFFLLSARRISLPAGSRDSRSLERAARVGSGRRARRSAAEVSR
jgi:hypothetical protein